MLQVAREHDLMPYFRLLEGQAGPVVTMEGAERMMLGVEQLPRPDRRRARDRPPPATRSTRTAPA